MIFIPLFALLLVIYRRFFLKVQLVASLGVVNIEWRRCRPAMCKRQWLIRRRRSRLFAGQALVRRFGGAGHEQLRTRTLHRGGHCRASCSV
jgi:hypothetical protein